MLSRADQTRAGDNAESILRRLGVYEPQLATSCAQNNDARRLFEAAPGKQVQARVGSEAGRWNWWRASRRRNAEQGQHPLHAPDDRARRRPVARQQRGGRARHRRCALASGTIQTSLFAATDEAELRDAIAIQMVEIFSADIDFHRELRRGDTFSVVYESLSADGAAGHLGRETGRVLAAEFSERRPRCTRRCGTPTATASRGYFGFDGQSERRAFLASPMEFSRVTSGFSMRLHPILQTWRRHLGVDYAAPDRHAGAQRSATASSSSPAGRTATATWCRSRTATTAARCMRT